MFVGLVAHSRRAALRLGLAAALAACGEVTQAPLPLDVTIAPSAVPALEIGDAVQLTAAVTGGRGSNVRSVVWTSSDPAVATISGAGAVTAVAPGQATITASAVADRGRTAQIGITVNAPRVTAITVTMPITTLNIGQAAAILAQVTATGIGSNRRVRFTSSAPQVATVRTDDGLTGVVTAVGGGEARIIAAAEIDPSRTAEVIVRVTGTRAAAIELTPTADSVLLGGTTMFAAIVRDSLGGAVSGATVQWVSTNPSIATVSASGEVRGVAIGEARVVASTPVEPGSPAVITAEAIVRVRSGLRVQVVPREATQLLTDQLTLGVSVFGESQTIDRTVDFVSRTPTVATVNASGVVTMVSVGTAVIIARLRADTMARDSSIITVLDPCGFYVTHTVGSVLRGSFGPANCRVDLGGVRALNQTIGFTIERAGTIAYRYQGFVPLSDFTLPFPERGVGVWGYVRLAPRANQRGVIFATPGLYFVDAYSRDLAEGLFEFETTRDPDPTTLCGVDKLAMPGAAFSVVLGGGCATEIVSGMTLVPGGGTVQVRATAAAFAVRLELCDPVRSCDTQPLGTSNAVGPGAPAQVSFRNPGVGARRWYVRLSSVTNGTSTGTIQVAIDP